MVHWTKIPQIVAIQFIPPTVMVCLCFILYSNCGRANNVEGMKFSSYCTYLTLLIMVGK